MKLSSHIIFLGVLLSILCSGQALDAQNSPATTTAGTLTFTVKSVTNNSTYSPKNVIAIWIKDAQGNFVVSRKVMASARKQHLVKWNASSAGNSVSATTGATLSSHQTHTITWDGKNASGIDMPDGNYQIWVEYTSTNSASNGNAGPSTMVEFTKGTAYQHITPVDITYYQSMVLDWVPNNVGIDDLTNAGAEAIAFPNPMSDKLFIHLKLDKKSQVGIYIFNLQGKKISVIEEDIKTAGIYNLEWNGNNDLGRKVPAGIYILYINVNGYNSAQKIIVN